MTQDQVAQLEARVGVLEFERRRDRLVMKLGVVVMAIGASIGALGAARTTRVAQTIEARREFMIRSETGDVLFRVGPEKDGMVLVLRDYTGRVTARLPLKTELSPLTQH